MQADLNCLILYARDVVRSAHFYQLFFGFQSSGEVEDGLINLFAPSSGLHLRIHQAAKGAKLNQAGVKLCFAVRNIEIFKQEAADLGLQFGPSQQGNGYSFANANDPDGNSISISSWAYRQS